MARKSSWVGGVAPAPMSFLWFSPTIKLSNQLAKAGVATTAANSRAVAVLEIHRSPWPRGNITNISPMYGQTCLLAMFAATGKNAFVEKAPEPRDRNDHVSSGKPRTPGAI